MSAANLVGLLHDLHSLIPSLLTLLLHEFELSCIVLNCLVLYWVHPAGTC